MRTKIGAVFLVSLFPFSGYAKSTVIDTKKNDNSVIGQWMAAGSGCQGSSDKPGDVQLVSVEHDATNPNVYTVVFALPNYRLKPLEVTKERPKVSLLNYARECAIRLNINPPSGKGIAAVTASSEFEVSKDINAKLLVQAALKIGATNVTKELKQYAKEENFKYRSLAIDLIPGRNPEDESPPIECEAKKIIGVDFTFLTNKDSESALAEARIAKDGLARFKVSIEDCGKLQK